MHSLVRLNNEVQIVETRTTDDAQLQVSNSIYECSNRNHNFRGQIHSYTTCAEGLFQNYMKKQTSRVERARNTGKCTLQCIDFRNSKCPCIPVKIDSASAFTRYCILHKCHTQATKGANYSKNHSSSQSKTLIIVSKTTCRPKAWFLVQKGAQKGFRKLVKNPIRCRLKYVNQSKSLYI